MPRAAGSGGTFHRIPAYIAHRSTGTDVWLIEFTYNFEQSLKYPSGTRRFTEVGLYTIKEFVCVCAMSFRFRQADCEVLKCLAEYRMLTMGQLAAVLGKGIQTVRRRLRDFGRQELLVKIGQESGRKRGRPESLVALTRQGVHLLKEKGLIDRNVQDERIVLDNLCGVDHQVLLNWFRIHLMQVERVMPGLRIKFLSHNSPFLPNPTRGCMYLTDSSPAEGPAGGEVRFTPDAVFGTTDSVAGKTCLFFLEVDCGTETLASPRRDMTDIRQKVVNYQWYFRNQRYKRHEQVFGCALRGFRLLFLTTTLGRLTAMCGLIQEMPPSNFIWLTCSERLFADGISSKIWAKGGDLRSPQQSIFGSLCCRDPLA